MAKVDGLLAHRELAGVVVMVPSCFPTLTRYTSTLMTGCVHHQGPNPGPARTTMITSLHPLSPHRTFIWLMKL